MSTINNKLLKGYEKVMGIKKLGIIVLLIMVIICCCGCSRDKSFDYNITKNVVTSNQYSENIQKIRAIVIENATDKSIGEILDNLLVDCSWSEHESYSSKTAKGCIQVSGKDKKSGEDVNIVWGIEMVNPNEKNHFEKMSKGRDKFLDYEYFKTYISK